MDGTHLNDETIQAFALDERYDDAGAVAHLAGCEACRNAVAAYRLMFSDIAGMPAAEIDFDVKALVLPQLPLQNGPEHIPKPLPVFGSILRPVLLGIAMAMTVFAGAGYIFLKDIGKIFGSSYPYLLYCAGPATILLVVWLVADMLNVYRQKMKQLEYY